MTNQDSQLLFFTDYMDSPSPPQWIAGTDEAGRGPLAGPVVAAAVMFPPDLEPKFIAGITDSKMLTEQERETYFDVVVKYAKTFAVFEVPPHKIDQINIRRASLLAMKESVAQLDPQPEYVLVDGRDYPDIPLPGKAVIKGDQLHQVIGAASILAKVSRDRTMLQLHQKYPQYGFDQHKGYPTRYHKAAVAIFGPCPEHRRTFSGVKESLEPPAPSKDFQEAYSELEQVHTQQQLEIFNKEIPERSLRALETYYLKQRAGYLQKALRQEERSKHPATIDIGKYWESTVRNYLQEKGYEILEQNFRGKHGEIDIIAEHNKHIIFIEVKARRSTKFGMPYEAVTPKKQKAITATADEYLYKHGWTDQKDLRYDIISVICPKNTSANIQHFEDAFRVEEAL